ncbi:aldose epimerase family protein [Dysosmobacter sp.]
MVRRTPFGTLDGRQISLVTLTDGAMSVELLPFGAAVRAIWVPDRDGRLRDVCLGYDTAEEYKTHDACFGGTIGRCANRIGGAGFVIGGRVCRLTANEGENTLHGGAEGFHKQLWDDRCGENSVTFSLLSPDGQEGFPGNLRVEVTYTLLGGTLTAEYWARSDDDTVVNLTDHTYFNLAGHNGGPVGDHRLTVLASAYTPAGAGNVPTGEIAPVEGTALDLRHGEWVKEALRQSELAASRGYDHNYVLDDGKRAAELWCPRTGISLEVSTTLPGMQVYTAGFLTPRTGKGGAAYGPGHAVCLEPQFFPDAVHHENFPSPILRSGQEYRQSISYRFDTK